MPALVSVRDSIDRCPLPLRHRNHWEKLMSRNPLKPGHADSVPNPLEVIDETTALDARDGIAILRGLARVLEDGDVASSYVEQVREAAEAVQVFAHLHPSLTGSGRDDHGAAGEHAREIRAALQLSRDSIDRRNSAPSS